MFLYDQRAFSSPYDNDGENGAPSSSEPTTPPLITAVARAPLEYENETLNVELFGMGWGIENDETSTTLNTTKNILLFIPGVCESVETWTVQNLAQICLREQWMLAVLELPGHGLSSGERSLLQPTGRVGLEKLVDIVVTFARHVVNIVGCTDHAVINVNLAMSGCSLGGVLAAYASPKIAQAIHLSRSNPQTQSKEPSNSDRFQQYPGFETLNFVGSILLSPAVGVAPQAVPPPLIVSALSFLAYIAPSAALMTPTEDPSHYNCPTKSRRNFSGLWPLGTSKLLLDITAEIVPHDIAKSMGDDDEKDTNGFCCNSPEIVFDSVVIAGKQDQVVPMDKVQAFVNAINHRRKGNFLHATLVEVPNGGHGLLVPQSVGKKSKVVEETSRHIQEALKRFANTSTNR
ncbi:MAG: hypothetical protein SGILL_005568 [Bacillariaceae sp.]